MKVMHKVAMEAQVREFEETNAALSKFLRAKKSLIRELEPLSMHIATDILANKNVQVQLGEEMWSYEEAHGRSTALY